MIVTPRLGKIYVSGYASVITNNSKYFFIITFKIFSFLCYQKRLNSCTKKYINLEEPRITVSTQTFIFKLWVGPSSKSNLHLRSGRHIFLNKHRDSENIFYISEFQVSYVIIFEFYFLLLHTLNL